MHAVEQAGGPTDEQTDGQTRQKDRKTERQTGGKTDIQTDRLQTETNKFSQTDVW